MVLKQSMMYDMGGNREGTYMIKLNLTELNYYTTSSSHLYIQFILLLLGFSSSSTTHMDTHYSANSTDRHPKIHSDTSIQI